MTEPGPIAPRLLRWAKRHGRHALPWQRPRDAYRTWVSEIMLQQTQVSTVIPYFERFMASFPDVARLADAPLESVLAHWSGLGYYARARNLHKAAGIVRDRHGCRLPVERAVLEDLPGIGRSTAAAILALAHDQRHAILDGNVKRVLARYHAVPGWPGESAVNKRLWDLAERHTPKRSVAAYTQAIMDLGALICTRGQPRCPACPLRTDCRARALDQVQTLPAPRPRREKRRRQRIFAVIIDTRGRVLLEQRRPSGIWGGLWCLPEWLDEPGCRHWLQQRFAVSDNTIRRLDSIDHIFTHFQLEMIPLQASVGDTATSLADEGYQHWWPLNDCQSLGLPAPVRNLLESISITEQEHTDDAHGALRKTG